MSTPATNSTALSDVQSFLATTFKTLADAEQVALLPPIIDFVTWANANPGNATNPLTVLPQINELGAKLLAAQVSAESAIVVSVSGIVLNALKARLAAAQAA